MSLYLGTLILSSIKYVAMVQVKEQVCFLQKSRCEAFSQKRLAALIFYAWKLCRPLILIQAAHSNPCTALNKAGVLHKQRKIDHTLRLAQVGNYDQLARQGISSLSHAFLPAILNCRCLHCGIWSARLHPQSDPAGLDYPPPECG